MSCISTTRKKELQAQLASEKARLAKLETAYDEAIAGGVESYRFDSGEGSQQVKRRDIDNLDKAIERTQAKIDMLNRKLRGTGILNMNLRRRGVV